ncbi:MAG: hypothetical protein WB424_12685, partial [Terracidiphilus sp.]
NAELKVLRDSTSSEELLYPDENAPKPVVRAEFLRWLASDTEAATLIDPLGLRVYAATIPGSLNLKNCHIKPVLDFRYCEFQEEIDLRSAETQGIFIFNSSLVKGIGADRVIVHGPLFLRRAQSKGEIRLLGAEIEDTLDCSGAKLKATDDALHADGVKIRGGVFLTDNFESEGTIRLLGAEITGQLTCTGAKLKATGHALFADGAKIGGDVFLNDGFESEGTIRLLGAEITGQLTCTGAKLKASGHALFADGAKIGGDVFLRNGFESEGTISLRGAEITGRLTCNGAKLKATGDAFNASRAKIGGDVFLRNGFESEGTIRLLGAEITGNLECTGAKLKVTGNTLFADGAKIGGGVYLNDGFESEGTIRMPGAEIGGDLTIRAAKVAEVVCHNTVIKVDLIWQKIEKCKANGLSLAGAKVKNLRDDKESWPNEGMLNLDGLVYEELTLHEPLSKENVKANNHAPELPLIAKERIAWIMLQPDDRRTEPQPWMQLRDLLEKKGDRKGAKYVLRRFRWLQAKKSWFLWRWWRKAFAWLEENPLRIGWSILFTLTLGTLVFAGGIRSGAMIETIRTQPNMISSYEESTMGKPRNPDASNKPVSLHYTSFQPFIYTLENAVPLVKLGMDERWMPDLQHQPREWFPQIGWMDGLKWFNSYGFLVWFRWALIVWGWIQATVLAAAVADRFKK